MEKVVAAGTIEGTINTCLEILTTIFYITENRGLYILVIRVSVSGEGSLAIALSRRGKE